MLEFDNEELYNVLQYDKDNAAIETMNMISRFSLDDYIKTMDMSLSPENSDLNSISSYYDTKYRIVHYRN